MSDTLITKAGGQYGRLKGTAAGQIAAFNGTDWVLGSNLSAIVPLGTQYVGNPAAGANLLSFVADKALLISATANDHQFFCRALPSGVNTATVTVYRTHLGTRSTVFVATFTGGTAQNANNLLYRASIGTIANNDIAVGDLIEFEVSTTNASWLTPILTASAVTV
jgi:hypothetical protein